MSKFDCRMRVVCDVRRAADRTYLALIQIKSPKAAFEERQAAVNVSIDQALKSLFHAQSRAESENFRQDLLRHTDEFHQLRRDYQATLDAKSKDFEHEGELVIDDLCRQLIDAVGLDLIQKTIRNLAKHSSDATSSNPTPASQHVSSAIEPEPEVVSPAGQTTESPPASSESPGRPGANDSSTRKRGADTEPESHGRRKRTAPTRKIMSSIWFDEVYQDGHAETKHIIVEHPKGADQWYIIRCQHCPRDFQDTPLRTAGSHLHSSQHGYQPRTATHIVENFGIMVLGCDEELAEKNNIVARRAFRSQEEGPRPQDDTAGSGSRNGRRGGGYIVSPTPGQIYLGYWGKAKKSWPVLLLPTAHLEDFGVPETLESLELLEQLPPCYRFDTTTKTLEWEEGFEDGGAKVTQRRFPVMFFDDDLEFPSESQTAWLAAKDLRAFDIESTVTSDVPHIRSVRAYLRGRAQTPSAVDPPHKTDVDDDAICQRNDETHQTPKVDNTNSPEIIYVAQWDAQVEAAPVPVINERSEPTCVPIPDTSTGPAENSDDNLPRNSFDIISISSSPAPTPVSHEIHPDEAAVPSTNKLDRTTSAPNAGIETTTSTNVGGNNPDQLNQPNTFVETTVETHYVVPSSCDKPAQVSESRAGYLATIAQDGLKKKLELSSSLPPGTGTVQEIAPRYAHHTEDSSRKINATYSDFIRQPSRSNPAIDATTIPPRAEVNRNPFRVPNPNFQHQGPSSPQVENRSITPAIPPAQPQPQPQLPTPPTPYHSNLRSEVAPERSTLQDPDPRRAGQHVS